MKTKGPLTALILSLLAAALFAACDRLPFRQTTAAQGPTAVDVRRGDLEVTATATGAVTLPKVSKLGFSGAVSGSQAGNTILAELNVAVGSRVKKGQVIARLDTSAQERDLLRYRNNLETAQINLQKAREPLFKPEEIIKAEGAVGTAKANLEVALETLKKAQAPFTENDFAIAEGAVRNARIALGSVQQELETIAKKDSLAIQDATENVMKTQRLLDQSKASEYEVFKATDNLVLLQKQAETNQVTIKNNIAKARDTLAAAEFTLADMLAKKGGDPLDIKQKETAVVNARIAVVNAEQSLSLMKRDPEPLDIRLRELQVNAAQLALDDALLQLEKSTIVAPFDGVIGDFKAKVGDTIQPGSFSIPLVDPTQIRIDAYVEEFDVMNVRVGMPADITMDALPGQRLAGRVESISPLATVQQGVVRYAVIIAASITGSGPAMSSAGQARATPGEGGRAPGTGQQRTGGSRGRTASSPPTELKDGLSATASIVISRKDNVLMVPNRSLILQRGEQKVQVVASGQTRDRVVKTGLSNDQLTEITEGLDDGDKVVVQNIPGRPAPGQMPGPGRIMIPGLR